MVKPVTYAGRLPYSSVTAEMNKGAMPWTIMYVVIVRLIFVMETLRACDMVLMAGKYIFVVRGLKQPPSVAIRISKVFSRAAKVV